MKAYPNPICHTITITGQDTGPVKIYDCQGLAMFTGICTGNDVLVVDVEALPRGVYFIRTPSTCIGFIKT